MHSLHVYIGTWSGKFLGHYITCGLNVKAVCDAESNLIFFGEIAPGRCSDKVTFLLSRAKLFHTRLSFSIN